MKRKVPVHVKFYKVALSTFVVIFVKNCLAQTQLFLTVVCYLLMRI